MLNKSVLVGRLTKDPAYFKKGDTIISTFCLAVERGYVIWLLTLLCAKLLGN